MPNLYGEPYLKEMWRSGHTVGSIILSMMDVFGNPNKVTPANGAAGVLYDKHIDKYYERVNEYKIHCEYAAAKDKIRIPTTIEAFQDPSTYKIVDEEDSLVVSLD